MIKDCGAGATGGLALHVRQASIRERKIPGSINFKVVQTFCSGYLAFVAAQVPNSAAAFARLFNLDPQNSALD